MSAVARRLFSLTQVAPMTNLSVISWNVWFDDFKKKERYHEILSTCRKLRPDVVCFQEVTPYFIKKIKEHNLIEKYDISDPDLRGSTIGSYGVLSMCRRELNASFQFHPLPTSMGRELLTVRFPSPHGEFCVGNVHLESLDSADIRQAQLKVCQPIIDKSHISILCGDFNFDSDRNFRENVTPLENDVLAQVIPHHKDLWLELHPPGTGKTFDANVNKMLWSGSEIMRYDRIMLRGSPLVNTPLPSRVMNFGRQIDKMVPNSDAISSIAEPIVVPQEINMLGTLPLESSMGNDVEPHFDLFSTPPKASRVVFPSDHFGLHAVLQLK